MSFPSLIPESVIVAGITVKIDAEPVLVWRVPFLFLYILKCPEAASYVIKHTVKNDFYIVCMEIFAYFCEIFIGSETAVDFFIIPGIITMIVWFENWI